MIQRKMEKAYRHCVSMKVTRVLGSVSILKNLNALLLDTVFCISFRPEEAEADTRPVSHFAKRVVYKFFHFVSSFTFCFVY